MKMMIMIMQSMMTLFQPSLHGLVPNTTVLVRDDDDNDDDAHFFHVDVRELLSSQLHL